MFFKHRNVLIVIVKRWFFFLLNCAYLSSTLPTILVVVH